MMSEARAAAWTAFLAAVRGVYVPAGYARSGSRFLSSSGDVVLSVWYQRDPRQAGRDIAFCVNLEVYLLRLLRLVPRGSTARAVVAGENPHWSDRLAGPDGDEWWSVDSLNADVAAEVADWHRQAARDLVLPRLAAHSSEAAVLAAWRAGDLRVSAERAAELISTLEVVMGGQRRSRALVLWGPSGRHVGGLSSGTA